MEMYTFLTEKIDIITLFSQNIQFLIHCCAWDDFFPKKLTFLLQKTVHVKFHPENVVDREAKVYFQYFDVMVEFLS